MTTATLTRSATRPEPGYGFRSTARMEWLKLRSVRSTPWILLVFAAGMIGLSVLVLSHTHWAAMSAADRATFDKPHQYAVGMKHVFVNGVQVLKDGEHTDAKPGRALWGPGKTK